MKLSDISRISQSLERAFVEVVVKGQKPVTIVAHKHARLRYTMSCSHPFVRRSTDVTAKIKKGYLVSAGKKERVYPYKWIESCSRCDYVFDSEGKAA